MKRLLTWLKLRRARPVKVTHTATGHIDLAVDRNGKRYTTHSFGFDGDPWQGATILTDGVVADLKRDGLLPLTEVPARRASSRAGDV